MPKMKICKVPEKMRKFNYTSKTQEEQLRAGHKHFTHQYVTQIVGYYNERTRWFEYAVARYNKLTGETEYFRV